MEDVINDLLDLGYTLDEAGLLEAIDDGTLTERESCDVQDWLDHCVIHCLAVA